ncbi:flagellar biosynthetic protein FliO [Thalassotalea fusca]
MIKRILFGGLLGTYSSQLFALTQTAASPVEVGKHAGTNVDALSMIMSLLMVLLVIVVSALVLKKFQRVNHASSAMKVVASLSLGTKERIVVVEVNGEQLLLGVSHQQITLLKTLESPIEVSNFLAEQVDNPLLKYFLKQNNKNETS